MKLFLFIFLFSFFSFAQKDFPDLVMDCQYASYSDNGKQIKYAIKQYENWLIESKLLADDSPRSYKKMIQLLALKTNILKFPSLNEFLYQNKEVHKVEIKSKECSEKLRLAMPASFESKLQRFQKVVATINHVSTSQHQFEKLDDIFDLSDFKYDFYKLELFAVMSLLNFTNGIKLMEYDDKKSDFDDSQTCINFNILLNSESLIIIENTGDSIGINDLKTQLIKHIERNNENACIVLKASGVAAYNKYLNIGEIAHEALLEVRNKVSITKFGKLFTELDESQSLEIRMNYPKRFIEQDIEE